MNDNDDDEDFQIDIDDYYVKIKIKKIIKSINFKTNNISSNTNSNNIFLIYSC